MLAFKFYMQIDADGYEAGTFHSLTPPEPSEGCTVAEIPDVLPQRPDDGEHWRFHTGRWRWEDTRTVPALRQCRWDEIKSRRDQLEFGTFVWDGSEFDIDAKSTARIMGAVQIAQLASAMGQPYSIEWTLADNTTRVLDGAQMISLGLALGAYVASLHETARAKRVSLQQASTPAEVIAVTLDF